MRSSSNLDLLFWPEEVARPLPIDIRRPQAARQRSGRWEVAALLVTIAICGLFFGLAFVGL